jgi:hypothetical protein
MAPVMPNARASVARIFLNIGLSCESAMPFRTSPQNEASVHL